MSAQKKRILRRPVSKLSLQHLEDRTVPAGTVSAVVADGILYVQGDDAGNALWVQVTGPGEVTVMPYDQTTSVNGHTAADGPDNQAVFTGVTRGYHLALGGGNDVLVVDGAQKRTSLFIDMGSGDDAVHVGHGRSTRGTTILTGPGDDYVSIGGSDLRGGTTIDTGDGSDTVNLGGGRYDRLTLAGGAGSNVLGAADIDVRRSLTVTGFTTRETLVPLVHADAAGVVVGQSTTINVAANDVAFPPLTLDLGSLVITAPPTRGTAAVGTGGSITYTNTSTAPGTDSFRYTVKASNGAVSAEGVVTITVTTIPDSTAPTATLSSTTTSPTKSTSFAFTATFNEDVTGFVASGVTVTNGSVATFTPVDARTYSFTVSPSAEGAVTARVAAGAAKDAAGNGNAASSVVSITYDATAPTVTATALTTNAASPTLSGTVDDSTATVAVAVAGQVLTATVANTTWTVSVPGVAEGSYDVTVTATDGAGNVGTATRVGGLVVDRTAPTTTLSSKVGNPTNAASFVANVTFNEDVTGFDATDVTVTNGSVSGFAAVDARTYSFTVTPTADGAVDVSLAAGAGADAAGNGSTAATLARTSDRTQPTATISTPSNQTSTSPIPFQIAFSEPVSGFVLADLAVTNGAAGSLQSVDGKTYSFVVTPAAAGVVDVTLPAGMAADAAGNSNPVSNTAAVTFSSLGINGLVTNDSTPAITGSVGDATAAINVTVAGQTFAATVTGNTWSATVPVALADGTYDISATATTGGGTDSETLTNGLVVDTTVPAVTANALSTTAADPVLTGSINDPTATVLVTVGGQTKTATITGTTWSATFAGQAEGTFTIGVTATDAAGNVGSASVPNGLVVDRTAPTVTATPLTTNSSNPALQGTVDDPTAVVVVTVAGQTKTAFVIGTAWAAVFSGVPDGTHTISVTATDAVGNVGSASLTGGLVVDRTAPTVTVNAVTTNAANPVLTGTVNDPTAKVAVTVNGQTLTATVSGSTWSVTVSAPPEGTFDVSVTATDPANNVGTASLLGALVVDRTLPVITVNPTGTGAVTGTSSDPATGVETVQVALSNGTAFWNGTAFSSGSAIYFNATTATSWATWSFPFAQAGTFTVLARARDYAGNLGETSVSVTLS